MLPVRIESLKSVSSQPALIRPMRISVIIPTYNEEKFIGKCLASLQKQKLDYGDDLEIIVVDDGSIDQTVHRIKQFVDVKLLHQSHLGPALARNQGAKHARGEILVFVDADMEFDPQCVKFLVRPIKRGHVHGTFTKDEFVANWQLAYARCWNWNLDLPSRRRLPLDHPDTGTDFRAISKKEFNRVKGFDNTGYTDTWTLPKKLRYQPYHAPGAVLYHHNPASTEEIFHHANWVGKRDYKLGLIGAFIALARSSLPMSLATGFYKSLKYREPALIPFKIIYDAGITWGILRMLVSGVRSK